MSRRKFVYYSRAGNGTGPNLLQFSFVKRRTASPGLGDEFIIGVFFIPVPFQKPHRNTVHYGVSHPFRDYAPAGRERPDLRGDLRLQPVSGYGCGIPCCGLFIFFGHV